MKTQSAEAVVRLMVAKDPQESAATILTFLMGINGARAGAIFTIDGAVRLFVGHRIDQDVLDWTAASWEKDQKTLEQGRLSRSDDRMLVPVVRGERLTALIYLAAGQLDLGSITEVSGLVAEALVRSARQPTPASAVESYLENTPAKEIERRKFLILLDRHEWNLARVARELQVTRTTVYKRLQAFGIARKRVPKDVRDPSPATTSS